MAKWMRFADAAGVKFGTLVDNQIAVCAGDMFNEATPSGESLQLEDVTVLTPVVPSKIVALANNSRAMLEKMNKPHPKRAHYFFKSISSSLAHGQAIRRPAGYEGKIIFEAELGLVIGKECRNVSVIDAPQYLFGCTCINDVTSIEQLFEDDLFAQWTRCKAADTFGPMGPIVDTDVDPNKVTITATLNDTQRQSFASHDYVFNAAEIISAVSRDMTLLPGDVIACGTSLGAGSMKPGSVIEITISGIGTLRNTFE